MLKTIYLGRLAGIKLYIHWTFWLLVIYLFLTQIQGGIGNALTSIGFAFAVFFCVFLHELGHAFSGRWFDVQTHDITLYPIGGVARMEAKELSPFAELVIAACGPLVNLTIAILIRLSLALNVSLENAADVGKMNPWEILFVANLALFCFNLLPVYPMDGGRILRSVLRFFVERSKAIEWTARLGQFLSAGLALYGLFTFQIALLIIFSMMFLACTAELFKIKFQRSFERSDANWDVGASTYGESGDTIDAEDVRQIR